MIVRLKTRTARTIVITCLTLAATAADESKTRDQPMLQHTQRRKRLTHRERARLLISRKADDIQAEGDRPVDEQRERLCPVHLVCAKVPDLVELAARPAVEDALDKGEGRHAHEEVERVEPKPAAAARLDDVGHDRLERGEKGAEQGEEEAGERE